MNTEAVAQEASPPTQAPRTRNHMAIINAQAAKGMYPAAAPKQQQLSAAIAAFAAALDRAAQWEIWATRCWSSASVPARYSAVASDAVVCDTSYN